jgi:hypothetical protein
MMRHTGISIGTDHGRYRIAATRGSGSNAVKVAARPAAAQVRIAMFAEPSAATSCREPCAYMRVNAL